MYLQEIGKIKRLTLEEERSLGEQIQQGLTAAARFIECKDNLSDEERADLQCVIEEGERAKIKIVEANLRLVVCIAKRYAADRTQCLDLIQEGNLGLMKAADEFDPSLGRRFSTYATW